jgi:hypothetical protein
MCPMTPLGLHRAVEASYELSPLQHGMLFHSLSSDASGVDIEQIICDLDEVLNAPALFKEQATAAAARRYLPRVYPGRITLFLPSTDEVSLADDRSLEWEAFAGSGLEVHPASPGCRADIMLQEPYAAVTGARLRQGLDRALAPTCSVRQR